MTVDPNWVKAVGVSAYYDKRGWHAGLEIQMVEEYLSRIPAVLVPSIAR
jgi:hypothetical protein